MNGLDDEFEKVQNLCKQGNELELKTSFVGFFYHSCGTVIPHTKGFYLITTFEAQM